MEMDRPPACYFASVQDGKQEIYLEWPNTFFKIEDKTIFEKLSPKIAVNYCKTVQVSVNHG